MLRSLCLSFIALAFVISVQSSSRTFAARVLISVFQQPSHVLFKQNIAVDLIRRGHDVYFALASGYPKTESLRRAGINVLFYQQQPNVIYPFSPKYEELMANYIFERIYDLSEFSGMVNDDCQTLLQDTEFIIQVRALKFDIAIVEPFLMNPCHIIIPQYLGIPFVSSSRGIFPFSFRLPALPSFYTMVRPGAELQDLPRLDTIYGRLMNAVALGFLRFIIIPQLWGNTTLLEKYTPEIGSWEQLMIKSEIFLLESDHYLDSMLPLLPHVINIAGCGARPSEPLPNELEKVMESSGENGVILASFGTSAYRMPGDIAKKFLDAFGRLKETVLTRMAVPRDVKVPANVRMQAWLPQNDILGHPKVKLFLTHSGTNSQYEALYHAVPMLGIPMFAEQGWNCVQARDRDIALCLDLLEFTADELYDNIRSLIDNATYRNSIQKLSEKWRGATGDGCEKAGFWIDHVIKYGSAHLRSPALDQPLYQFLMLDIFGLCILFGLGLTLFVGLTVRCSVTKLWRTCRKRKRE